MKVRFFTLLMLLGIACSDESTTAGSGVIAMRFIALPSSVSVDSPFSVSVEILGANGERATDIVTTATLSLVGSGTLTGTTTATTSAGVASFTGLRVSNASESLQFKVTAGGITATSATFRATDACAPVNVTLPLSITGTLSTSACVVNGSPALFYRFTKADFGALQITATATDGSPAPTIALLNDPPSDFIPIEPTGSVTTGNWIIPASMYRLRVTSATGAGGGFAISSSTTPAVGCVVRTLLPFSLITYSGRIDATDCAAAGINSDVYQVYSPKPCAMVMRGTAATFDAMLTIRNARTHATIVQDDNSGGGVSGKDAFVTLTECRAGTDPIEIVAATTTAQSGDYTFALQISGGVSTFLIGNGAER